MRTEENGWDEHVGGLFRIDVGIMLKDSGELGYFVNEVERTLTAGSGRRNSNYITTYSLGRLPRPCHAGQIASLTFAVR